MNGFEFLNVGLIGTKVRAKIAYHESVLDSSLGHPQLSLLEMCSFVRSAFVTFARVAVRGDKDRDRILLNLSFEVLHREMLNACYFWENG